MRRIKTTVNRIIRAALVGFVFFLLVNQSVALTLPLPKDGSDIIGKLQFTKVKPGESLADVSRRFKMGAKEVMDANPRLQPWTPTVGSAVIIPSQFILPPGPREGIVINLAEMRLYYYHPNEPLVTTYPISVGKEGWATPLGHTVIVDKQENPVWTVPESILEEKRLKGIYDFPKTVPAGPDNPLGKYAFRLGLPGILIHGTNRTKGIGLRVSHGCIRMYPFAIEEMFDKVAVGTPVKIIHEPYKFGFHNGKLYLEAHRPMQDPETQYSQGADHLTKSLLRIISNNISRDLFHEARRIAVRSVGMPVILE